MDIPLSATSDIAFTTLLVIGTAAFAASGAVAAIRSHMDWFGVVVLACIVAVGGGTVRDVVLGDLPVHWVRLVWPVLLAGGVGLVVLPLTSRLVADITSTRVVLVADAIGLGVFAIVGTDRALHFGTNQGIAVILGLVTGIGGGIMRDVLVQRRPLVLTQDVYALAALTGAGAYVLLLDAGVVAEVAVWLGVAIVSVIRISAIALRWSVPPAKAVDQS
jgi:uncharacterized membrane protein YeiH